MDPQSFEKKIDEHIDDEKLIAMILGNQDFFTLLISRFEGKLRRYIGRISNQNAQDKEDLLQDVFVKIYLNLNDFDTNLSLNAWVYRVTHNLVIDRHRKNKRQEAHGKFDVDDEIFVFHSNPSSFLEDVYNRESKEFIAKVMSSMSLKNREILYLRFMENYSYKDISDILKKSESNVTSMLFRAKKEFKEKYEELRK